MREKRGSRTQGTFNANPVSATAGIATLGKIAREPINDRADAMAVRLKTGLRDSLNRMEVPGQVHGLASVVHVALGVEAEDEEISTVPHDTLAEATAAQSGNLKLAMLNEGVDMMGGIGFMVSAAHPHGGRGRPDGRGLRAGPGGAAGRGRDIDGPNRHSGLEPESRGAGWALAALKAGGEI